MSESMKAVVITQPGGVEVLELRDVERPGRISWSVWLLLD